VTADRISGAWAERALAGRGVADPNPERKEGGYRKRASVGAVQPAVRQGRFSVRVVLLPFAMGYAGAARTRILGRALFT
jgi:hypothetical protein